MKIINPLQMNDWEIKGFLSVVLAIQLALWAVLGLDTINHPIPILRELIAFIYLTFVPGILIIRILKLHKLGNIKVILYSVGLSLSTLMFTGLFMNTILPLFGIFRPISLYPLMYTISIFVVILSIFAYSRDRNFSSPDHIIFQEIFSPPVLILSLFPFIAIGGTYIVNFYNSNLLLMILLLFVALVPLVIIFTKFIPEQYYPYAIFALAITLLFHHALISMYIWGWDIQAEYYITNQVIQNAVWNSTLYGNLNAMLSLVILAPIYSIILNMGIDWVFKIVYPFLFAFVPLGLYAIFRQQTDEKIAFFACFFFISFFSFYSDMLALARQEIAEFFLVLIILSIIDRDLLKFPKLIFFLVFSLSLIVSHYGLSYLFMLILLIAWIIGAVGFHVSSRKSIIQLCTWFQGLSDFQAETNLKNLFRTNVLHFYSVLWFGIIILIWYIFTVGSSPFVSIVHIGYDITTSMYSNLLDPNKAQGLGLILKKASTPLYEASKYLHLLSIFLIVIGFISSVVRPKGLQFDNRYILLSFGALIICIGGVVLPYFASALNTSRLYQITLILLAPFCVLGGITVFRVISGVIKISWTKQCVKNSLQILSVFFALFLLFNSGWVYEIAKDHPNDILNTTYDYPKINKAELTGEKWLTDAKYDKLIYADGYRSWLLLRLNPEQNIILIPKNVSEISEQSYIYLGNFNIKNNSVLITSYNNDIAGYFDSGDFLTTRSKIFDIGDAEVYYR
jgi:uncharacterized membrane protein